MPEMIDLTGRVFGRLKVLELLDERKNTECIWRCLCECGKYEYFSTSRLRRGFVKQCEECFIADRNIERKLKPVWRKMKNRCYNPKDSKYKDYGQRGISICDLWRNDFASFKSWAISSGYKYGLSIDRINNDGNYEPSNCRWTTNQEQANNRRTNIHIIYNGESRTAKQWAQFFNINLSTLIKIYKEDGYIGNNLFVRKMNLKKRKVKK